MNVVPVFNENDAVMSKRSPSPVRFQIVADQPLLSAPRRVVRRGVWAEGKPLVAAVPPAPGDRRSCRASSLRHASSYDGADAAPAVVVMSHNILEHQFLTIKLLHGTLSCHTHRTHCTGVGERQARPLPRQRWPRGAAGDAAEGGPAPAVHRRQRRVHRQPGPPGVGAPAHLQPAGEPSYSLSLLEVSAFSQPLVTPTVLPLLPLKHCHRHSTPILA